MKMKTVAVLIGLAFCVGLLGCCSPREAATVGAMIGRPFGNVLGAGAVAVEETFMTAGDVRDANPRFESKPRRSCAVRPACAVSSSCGTARDDTHYYEVRAIVQTEGPASIEDVTFKDAQDVTEFWN